MMNKYEFHPWTEAYLAWYEEEKIVLEKIALDAEIHHVGSTAVQGLGGKAVLDIMVAVEEAKWDESIKALSQTYEHHQDKERDERAFFSREDKGRLIHIHLTTLGSAELKRTLAFRDFLRDHADWAKKYEESKKGEGEEYRTHKQEIITRILQEIEQVKHT